MSTLEGEEEGGRERRKEKRGRNGMADEVSCLFTSVSEVVLNDVQHTSHLRENEHPMTSEGGEREEERREYAEERKKIETRVHCQGYLGWR